MKPSPIKYALQSMAFIGLVSTQIILNTALAAAMGFGLASAIWGAKGK